MPRLVFLLLLLFATSAGARMYQWQDPVTKSVQFSGVPPAWYRSPEGGPRVRVYDGGTLIDDTYIRLSPEDNATLREAAFRVLEQEREQEAIKRLERAARREQARRDQAEREHEAKGAGQAFHGRYFFTTRSRNAGSTNGSWVCSCHCRSSLRRRERTR